MKKIERKDIQGMIIYGYKYLPVAYYLFLHVEDFSGFKKWLSQATFQHGESSPKKSCMNIAFSSHGLQALGVTIDEDNGFSRAFIEGMDTEHRNRILGDYDANGSQHWEWGKKDDTQLHAVLMLFAQDEVSLEKYYQEQLEVLVQYGITESLPKIASQMLAEGKEHFGFKDGISQPVIRGLDRDSAEDNYVNPGEFILGYPNDYNKAPNSPVLQRDGFDFGVNGSYMVFRQLEQDVPLFWETVCGYFGGIEQGEKQGIELASKMVGRWPNGNPLHKSATDPLDEKSLNSFSFYESDQQGTLCPFGSHIRRTNPRNSLSVNGKKSSLKEATDAANKHRILRRGRPYGPPLDETLAIEQMLTKIGEDKESRGLNFICFNTDIDRQFEFVQHTWANNIKFHNLYNDVDPIMGVQRGTKDSSGNYQMAKTQFEVQSKPVRKRYQSIPPFVKVKGGSYFFMPGIQAINYLSKL